MRRLEALEEARAAGLFGRVAPIRRSFARGWIGARPLDGRTDDWEPAIAADPNAPYVYVLATRYGEPKPCPGNCPTPFIALAVSDDEGLTWSRSEALCPCTGRGQFDPIIEVVLETGAVYALYMNGFNVMFIKSSDHGASWTTPVRTYGTVAWNDKPVLATSDDGRDIYVSWNGPTGGDPWIAQSHDFGVTWSQTRLVNGRRYFFAFDADVLADGTVAFSESSFDYSGPGGSAVGMVRHHVFVSRDLGRSWQTQLVDAVELGEPCVSDGCYDDFYAGRSSVTADPSGDLAFLYDGARRPGGPQRIWMRHSSDGGRTWSARSAMSRPGRMASSPAAEFAGDGDLRAWYYEREPGGRWNVFYRSSTDGGLAWSPRRKISDAISGARYKNAEGFLEVYGDYGEIAITSSGATVAAWGEGFSWLGPGGVWLNVQL